MLKDHSPQGIILHTDTNEVTVRNLKHKLTPKEMGVLEMLHTNMGMTIKRNELLNRVWGDKYANDQGLTQAISRLRNVLSKNRGVRIRTVPKKGYRLEMVDVPKENSFIGRTRIRAKTVMYAIVVLLISLLLFTKDINIRVEKEPVADESSKIGSDSSQR